MRYVGLLRGVNVGGNRKVPMAELRALYESLGFTRVATYLNSGNIIFDSEDAPDIHAIDVAMEKVFGFPISTLIVSGDDMIRIADEIPKHWKNDATQEKTDVVYLFGDIDSPEVLEKLGYRPEFEELRYVGGAILMNLDRKYQSRSSMLRAIGTSIFQNMTIRNVNTARKLAELVQD